MSEKESIVRDEFFEGLLGDFLDESGQLLDRLNENLLRLDEWAKEIDPGEYHRCDESLLNDMFRSAHSLKGLSAMLGLKEINTLTHKVENVFDAARRDELPITSDVVDLIFQALDRLTGLVDVLKDPTTEPVECESVLDGIRHVLQQAGVERAQSSQAEAEKALQQTDPAAESSPNVVHAAVQVSPPSPADTTPEVACNTTPTASEVSAAVAASISPSETPALPASTAVATPVVDVFASLQDETEVPARYLSIFIDETDMSLDSLTETLLAMEGGGTREAKDTLLVISHRIKGSAASLGLNRAAKLAHLMEDLLQYLVETGRSLSPEMTDAMLKCTDALRQYVQGLRSKTPSADRFAEVASDLIAARQLDNPAAAEPVVQAAAAVAASRPVESTVGDGPAVFADFRSRLSVILTDEEKAVVGMVTFQPNLALAGLKARLVYEKLSNLGDVRCFEPPVESLDEMASLPSVSFALSTDKPIATVRQQLRIGGVQQTVVEPWENRSGAATTRPAATQPATACQRAPARVAESVNTPPAAGNAAPGAQASRATETLRVDIERLDQLMNLAGQLVISKARFTQIGDSLKNALVNKQSQQAINNISATLAKFAAVDASTDADNIHAELDSLRASARRIQHDLEIVRRDVAAMGKVRGSINNLFEAIHQLDRVADGIQRNVMDTRMVPIGPLFTRFKRVIRDITRSNGKIVNLVINGEKTELDKRMIDELGDPLIHMVRNSADHGIEMPEVRRAAGKPEQGTVTLNAFHRGNSIIIQVCDDGKGLDAERIRRKAIDKGLITEADADRLSRQQIYQMIWEPGLSTAEKVTEVSGRGMGMDIVKSKIEELHGAVELDSEPGQGTTMTIKLPLTLAILPSLMVEIQGDVYAMPLEAVEEIVRVARQDLKTVHGKSTACVRGRVISVVQLEELFSWSRSGKASETNLNDKALVIIGDTGREVGLAVDRVMGEEDVVIKSLAENYRNVAGVAGASILGDGRVSLILDIAALIEMSSGRNASALSGVLARN